MSTKRRGRSSPRTSLLKTALRWIVVAGLWAGIFIGGLFAWYAQELPSITRNAAFTRKASITVKAADGTVIGRYGEIKGRNISADDLPANLVSAVLATEDRRFYSHPGMDIVGFGRAFLVNIRRGKFVQGGSTITQQLAKNLFLSQERTIKRKIQEAMLAFWLEYQLSKDEILSAYLNRVYMGSGTYGVDAASRLYFDKNVKDLTLREAATLAGLLKAPSRFSPLANPDLSRQRTNTVLKSMVDAGFITEVQEKELAKLPPRPDKKPVGGDSARYYTDWVVDDLQDLIGTPDEDIIVETTLDTSIQRFAQGALVNSISKNGEEKRISQGSVIVMRPTGEVLAMVGGFDYASNQFNRAVQARRQPGSSFKPIVYLAALEKGWRPGDIILDAPFTEGKYRPKNFGNEYYGEVTVGTALMLSLNTVSIRLAKSIGPGAVIDLARRLGITSKLEENLSLALGTSSLSPLEMTAAYAVIANGGSAIHPVAIIKVVSQKGQLYYQRQTPKDRMFVVAGSHLRNLKSMMADVIQYGTGQRARVPFPAYGKTGTSQDSRDAWFIGFTPEIVTSVWMGNDDNSPMKNVTGGSFPADVWREVMIESHGRYPPVALAGNRVPSSSNFQSLMDRLAMQPPPSPPPLEQQRGRIMLFKEPPRERTWFKPKPADERSIPESSRYND